MDNCHFSGYATRNDLLCGDGRTIRKNAFKDDDGRNVPLIWNHDHTNPDAVLGHALLENREDGVYAYCTFNDSDSGKHARTLVEHGDVRSLSIYANKLKQIGQDVIHGAIQELSLVLAGANPGAYIDFVMAHDEDGEDAVYANYDENALVIYHSADNKNDKEDNTAKEDSEGTDTETSDDKNRMDRVWKSIMDKTTEEEQALIYGMIAANEADDEESGEDSEEESGEDSEEESENKNTDDNVRHSEEGDNSMKHNVFENDAQQNNTLMHADIVADAIADGKRYGSLRDSVLAHAAANNITNVGELFPQPKDLNVPPEWLKNDDGWVSKIMGSVHHTPFSRVRMMFAQMDETEARARGYIKGKEKANLKLAVLKRTTQPTTVYIKMKADRDDLVDISFDALPWIRAEARNQLNKELARAYLLGDGRDPSSDDKIDEQCIRPVITDDDMYTIKYTVKAGRDYKNTANSASDNDSEAKGVVRAAIRSRKGYKGSGKPTFFTTEDQLTELLLIEDQNGRRVYNSEAELATAMRVKEIVTVPEMEQYTDIYGIIVNMNDYNVGADKGGEVNMFDDFDIDYNQEKFLMETRCSAALVKPKSAIVLKKETSTSTTEGEDPDA